MPWQNVAERLQVGQLNYLLKNLENGLGHQRKKDRAEQRVAKTLYSK